MERLKNNYVMMLTLSELLTSITQFMLAITGLSGIFGLFWGIYRYREGQNMKRKEVLFELIKEYDDPDSLMNLAIHLLDDHVVPSKNEWMHRGLYYCNANFNLILRDHKNSSIDDPGEMAIRESFDSLLEFFGKLGYLLKVGIIKKDEILYFQYTLNQLKNDPYVKLYTKTYNFQLYEELLCQLNS